MSADEIYSCLQNCDPRQIRSAIANGTLDPALKLPYGQSLLMLVVAAIEDDCKDADAKAEMSALAVDLIRNEGSKSQTKRSFSTLLIGTRDRNVINALIEAGADINQRAAKHEDGGGETALIIASEKRELWAVERLIEAGADVNALTYRKENALFWAVQGSTGNSEATRSAHRKISIDIINRLLRAGATWQGNELHTSVWIRDAAMVDHVIKSGCPVNGRFLRNEQSSQLVKDDTPLIVAVRKTFAEQMQIEAQWIQAEDRGVAVESRRRKIIEGLLNAGADPTLRNQNGCSAIDYATSQREPEYIELLLRYKRK